MRWLNDRGLLISDSVHNAVLGLLFGILVGVSFMWSSMAQAVGPNTDQIFCNIDRAFEEIDGVLHPIFFPDTTCTPAPAQCADGIDNDGDGKIDLADPGCASASDTDESNPPPAACADGLDNDGDGKIDLADPGCANASDNDETNTAAPPACADGIDNDGDGKIDLQDPGCANAGDTDETDGGGSTPPPSPSPPPSPTPSPSPAPGGGGTGTDCADGRDNDGDGKVDLQDPGCTDSTDTSEQDPTSSTGGGGPISGSLAFGSGGGATPPPAVLGTATADCSTYISGFIKPGAQNDASQVMRLQQFLNQFEGNSLAATGVYDLPTITAVNVFQLKYASEVLHPWGITNATNYVYITTRKKINELYCKGLKSFPFTPAEAEEIRMFKESLIASSAIVPGPVPEAVASLASLAPRSSSAAPQVSGGASGGQEALPSVAGGETQVATPITAATSTAGEADEGPSFLERLWRGIRGWF